MPHGVVKVDITQPGYHRGRVLSSKGKTYPVEILTPEEIRALAAHCSTTTNTGIRHRALIVLLYRTGLRIGEALALRPKDVNLEIGSVVVLHGKEDKLPTVGIDPGANPHIEAWLKRRTTLRPPPHAPLFCKLNGGQMDPSDVRKMLRRLAVRAGISKRVHPHGLRHTHAYELAMEDVLMPIIQRQLGHSSLQSTSVYLSPIAPKLVIETMGKREWSP
jgi:site-specific recombinase XerD